ncbi:MAG: hypothetical protein PHC61_11610, partial [Chitinivibrionales bacterium]|nr:hypothetical protein [Chitinivibrionales bacterium]
RGDLFTPGDGPDARQILLAGANDTVRQLIRNAGFTIIPSANVQLQNLNDWTTIDTLNPSSGGFNHRSLVFHSFNDCKLFFMNGGAMWQTRWEYFYYRLTDQYHQQGFTHYEETPLPWLRTAVTVNANMSARPEHDSLAVNAGAGGTDTVSLPATDTLAIGPGLSVGFSFGKVWCFKSILNTHSFALSESRVNGSWQKEIGMNYNVFVQLIILPNISVIATNSFGFSTSAFTSYQGNFSLLVIF